MSIETLQENGVSEETITQLETKFQNELTTVLENNNITMSEEDTMDDALELFFDSLCDIGNDETEEFAQEVLNDFETHAGKYNVHFVCGLAIARKPDSELANIAKQLYGSKEE